MLDLDESHELFSASMLNALHVISCSSVWCIVELVVQQFCWQHMDLNLMLRCFLLALCITDWSMLLGFYQIKDYRKLSIWLCSLFANNHSFSSRFGYRSRPLCSILSIYFSSGELNLRKPLYGTLLLSFIARCIIMCRKDIWWSFLDWILDSYDMGLFCGCN